MTNQTTGIRPYGPGKFDTIMDSYVYKVSLDGPDDETGSISVNGVWYGMIENGADGTLASAIAQAALGGGEALTFDELEMILRDFAGVIMSENDQGFVGVEYYATADELRQAWDIVLADVDEAMEEEEEA